ncbi:MAG: zinc-ribbon domain-containing protein [Acidobacteriota bacterium]|nr:zinc-ribbon domain-containing protein [Acidobacteriota bacterium]
MYCPSCAVQNVEGASYCRACGANISLVPQAMTGRLPEAVGGRMIWRRMLRAAGAGTEVR